MPLTIAVAGASGFVGSTMVNHLVHQGKFEVRGLSRRGDTTVAPAPPRFTPVRGSIADPAALAKWLSPGCSVVNFAFDSVASSEANLALATALADACIRHGVRRLVHCSTAVVVGSTDTPRINETTECRPRTEYEKTKLAIEDLLRERARGRFELAILRPTAVFGPGGRNLLKLAGDLVRGPRLVNYLRSSLNGRRRMHLVSVDNVVAAAGFLLQSAPRAGQETYIVSDDEVPENNFHDVERALMKSFGIPDYAPPRVPVPAAILSGLLRARGRSMIRPDSVFAGDRLAQIGFSKPMAFGPALATFANWYRETAGRRPGPH